VPSTSSPFAYSAWDGSRQQRATWFYSRLYGWDYTMIEHHAEPTPIDRGAATRLADPARASGPVVRYSERLRSTNAWPGGPRHGRVEGWIACVAPTNGHVFALLHGAYGDHADGQPATDQHAPTNSVSAAEKTVSKKTDAALTACGARCTLCRLQLDRLLTSSAR